MAAGAGDDEVHEGLTILHFDAHPDLYDELDGDRYSRTCPFARIMEEGKVARLIQFGFDDDTHQREQAERFGVGLRARSGVSMVDDLRGPVYVSIDIDVLDPAYAPATMSQVDGRPAKCLMHSLRSRLRVCPLSGLIF